MVELTEKQKYFLFEKFFQHNTNYHGANVIAYTLLSTGKCIVASTDKVWVGGIGNFIKTELHPEGVGCYLYTFNIENFLNSLLFRDSLEHELKEQKIKEQEIHEYINELEKLIK